VILLKKCYRDTLHSILVSIVAGMLDIVCEVVLLQCSL